MLNALRQRFKVWLFRPKIESGTVVLTQRRIFIIPTKHGLGLMARWTLSVGHTHDSQQAVPLFAGLHPCSMFADKAYDADALIAHIQEIGATAVIPPHANRLSQRSFDKHQYKHRNLIERFFLRIKHFRRIATRYDKLAERFSSFIAIVATFLWLA